MCSFLCSLLQVTQTQIRVLETKPHLNKPNYGDGDDDDDGDGGDDRRWCDLVVRVELNMALMLMRMKSKLYTQMA